MNKKIELQILHLIAIKNETTARANMELDRGGWTIDFDCIQREISADIDRLLNGIA